MSSNASLCTQLTFNECYEHTCSSLSAAIKHDNLNLFLTLLANGCTFNIGDNRGWRPLHEAVVCPSENHLTFIKELLKQEDLDINCKTHEGQTPLLLTFLYKQTNGEKLPSERYLDIASLLLKCGADANVADNELETPLLIAAKNGLSSVVEYLCTIELIDVNLADIGGWNPLLEASSKGDLIMLNALLKRDADLDVYDECGMSPLFTAAQNGHFECLQILIDHALKQNKNYVLNKGANDGATPLMIAAQVGHKNLIELLIENKADVNKCAYDGVNALHLAVEGGHKEIVELLMKHMNIQQMKEKLMPNLAKLTIRNPLHLAISNGHYDCVDALLKNGFPVDLVDYYFGNKFSLSHPSAPRYITALGLAVTLNNHSVSKLLLEHGANVNAVHESVFAPLHCIFSVVDVEYERGNNYQLLQLLLAANANVNYTMNNESPNELLHAIFKLDHFHLLLEYGFDTCTCFKDILIHSNRFIRLSFHNLTIDWYLNDLLKVVKLIERTSIAKDIFLRLRDKIDTIYRLQYGFTEYTLDVWQPIVDIFNTPATLQEQCRFKIRHQLNKHKVSGDDNRLFTKLVDQLCLPKSLKNYLLFRV